MQILPRMSICLQIHRYVLINSNWEAIIDLPTEDTALGTVSVFSFYFGKSLVQLVVRQDLQI